MCVLSKLEGNKPLFAEAFCQMRKEHSLLFVPANEKMLGKLGKLGADSYIIDLEDSIIEDRKDDALKLTLERLASVDCDDVKVIVRLNKERYMSELRALSYFNVGFMLPKFETPQEYKGVESFAGIHAIYALVETPKGIACLSDIASCSYVYALAFGAEDFTASVGMKNDIRYLSYQKSSLVTYARAYGKKVFDSPSFQLDSIELFRQEVEDTRNLGFDGKMAINPKHLPYIKETFSESDVDRMQEIVNEYEKSGQAVLVIDGKAYEKMHITHMKKIIKEKGE